MKNTKPGRRCKLRLCARLLAAASLALSLALTLAACGGGSDSGENSGGIIGTGMQLRGTVHDKRRVATSDVRIKAATGERSTASIDSGGRFEAASIQGTGPYLLRVDLGNGDAYYSLAEQALQTQTPVTQNIHAYTDLVIRNWFATQGQNIDTVFDDSSAIPDLPTPAEIGLIQARINSLIAPSLSLYGLAGTNLSTTSFNNDNTGIDNFLDRNPVLINNGNITIIITEPAGGAQTTVTNNVPLATDLTVDDLIPPSQPNDLRALPSAMDEIVLAWTPSTDNVGVVSYEIMRDSVLVGTSAFPVFLDSPLQSGVDYTYSVTAVDASENRSAMSEAVSARTLAAPDTTAPPTPTALTLVPSSTSISLSWAQSAINDVAAFRVLSGEGQGMLEALARVTSTTLTDAGLNSGVEYCYLVSAIDASENESAPTDIVCATTTGSPVSGGSEPIEDPQPTISGDFLSSIDVSGLQCDLVFEDDVSTVVTLDQPCYRVTETIDVRDGGQLVVSAGTVLKFESGAGLTVRQGGSLTTNGTSAAPVVFSAIDPTPGIWRGVEFVFSNSSRNSLNNTLVEYGGVSNGAAIKTTSSSNSPSRLSLSNVLTRNSIGYGYFFAANTILTDTAGLSATANAAAIRASVDTISNVSADSRFVGNTVDRVELINGTITTPSTWRRFDAPYSLDSITVRSTLSIEAGSRLEFESGGDLRVEQAGSLSALGTASETIVFTGEQTTPGYWDGIGFVFSNSVNNRLEHVVIEYAGSSATSGGGLVTVSSNISPSRLSVDNAILRLNSGPGFRLMQNTLVDQFSNVQSTGNDQSGVTGLNGLPVFGANNDFTGNMSDGVRVFDQTLSTAASWPAINVPYLIDTMRIQAQLTLSAGARFIVDAGGSIRVERNGSLLATGTVLAPIEFSGSSSTPGHWDGIDFAFSTGPNVLDHVNIAHAGGGGTPATRGSVVAICSPSGVVTLAIRNSSISDSASNGVYTNQSSCNVTVEPSVTFNNVALENVVITP